MLSFRRRLFRFMTGALMMSLMMLAGCESDADIAAKNISSAADNFEINRRIVFYNTMTDTYMLVVEGRCSLGNTDTSLRMSVICKVGPNAFKRHFLGLASTVSFVVEQLDAVDVSTFHYRVVFKPQAILPDVDFRGSAQELTRNRN